MFRIIVLHKRMSTSLRESGVKVRHKRFTNNFHLQLFVHDTFQVADGCRTMHADSVSYERQPNYKLTSFLASVVRSPCGSKLPVWQQLYCWLICEYHILEVVFAVSLGEFQPLFFVGLANHLAVSATTEGPAKRRSTTENRTTWNIDILTLEEGVKLHSRCLVILLHLCFDDLLE